MTPGAASTTRGRSRLQLLESGAIRPSEAVSDSVTTKKYRRYLLSLFQRLRVYRYAALTHLVEPLSPTLRQGDKQKIQRVRPILPQRF